MLVIAHRGASGHRPENTLPAYELAIEMRSDMIEIDLHKTKDGHIVITHDAELRGLGEIADHTLEEARSLDMGEGEKIPILDEVLDGFASRIPFNLEIKWGAAGDYDRLEEQTLEALRTRASAPTSSSLPFASPCWGGCATGTPRRVWPCSSRRSRRTTPSIRPSSTPPRSAAKR